MGVFDPWDWLVIALVALFLFGPKRIPEMARLLGKGIREFKDAFKDSVESPREVKPQAVVLSAAALPENKLN